MKKVKVISVFSKTEDSKIDENCRFAKNKLFLVIFFIVIVFIFALININLVSAKDNSSEKDNNKISIELRWNDEDIVNGKEFEINVKAVNLKDKDYDVKVFISDNDKIISQTYNNDKWITSNNYIKNFFKGPDDESKIKLRINEKNKDFSGKAKIGARIRETGSSSYKEISEKIEVIKSNADNEDKTEIDKKTEDKGKINEEKGAEIIDKSEKGKASSVSEKTENSEIAEEVIKLGSNKLKTEDIKTQNNIVYESKNELIKKYSIYGFALLCIILIILLVFKKI